MAASVYEENEILHETGVELVCLLYAEAIGRLSQAIRDLEDSPTKEPWGAIGDVIAIVIELQGSLNQEAGGEIAKDLARLYDYIQQKLLGALTQTTSEALRQVRDLLETLLEGWQDCRDALQTSAEGQPLEVIAAGREEHRAWTL